MIGVQFPPLHRGVHPVREVEGGVELRGVAELACQPALAATMRNAEAALKRVRMEARVLFREG
jgi:hypothetical protein